MPRKPKGKVEGNTITIDAYNIKDALDAFIQKPIEITSASIKEQKCNYGYEIKTGPTAGDKIPTRKGEGIIHKDMQKAVDALRVHLAVADNAFKHVFPELPPLEDLLNHEITIGYSVHGFKVTGNNENEGYFIEGEKWVPLGLMGVDTPKISANSSYKYWTDLKEKMALCRAEVEEYMNGKHDDETDEDDQPELPFPGGNTSADEFDDEE